MSIYWCGNKIAKWENSEMVGVVFPVSPIHHFAQFSCRINIMARKVAPEIKDPSAIELGE
jgi:hypothetical protein